MKKRVSQMDELSPFIEGAQLEGITVSWENMMSYLGCSGDGQEGELCLEISGHQLGIQNWALDKGRKLNMVDLDVVRCTQISEHRAKFGEMPPYLERREDKETMKIEAIE